jgi:CheY-like chemotaxis protein
VGARTAPRVLVGDRPGGEVVLASPLRACGFEVRVVLTGPDVLTTARRYCPDAVFLGLELPGLGGEEVARLLRRRHGPGRPLLIALVEEGELTPAGKIFDAVLVRSAAAAVLRRLLADGGKERASRF